MIINKPVIMSNQIFDNAMINYKQIIYLWSKIHIISVKKEHLRLNVKLSQDTVSKTAKEERADIAINAGFFDVNTLLPFMGYRDSNYKVQVIRNFPGVVFRDGEAKILKQVINDKENYFQCGPILVYNYSEMSDYSYFIDNKNLFDSYIDDSPAPRSVFAEDEDTYYFIAVDGRSDKSRGLHFKELTSWLLELKIKNAINLDGGSSSTLFIKNQVVNVPSGNKRLNIPFGKERKVSTIILGCIV